MSSSKTLMTYIHSSRNIKIIKNDRTRVRVVCKWITLCAKFSNVRAGCLVEEEASLSIVMLTK